MSLSARMRPRAPSLILPGRFWGYGWSMMLAPSFPASGATFCQSSSVMKGIMGWASRKVVSSTRVRVRRVARYTASLLHCQLYFRKFKVPVAILIPDKFIDFPCRKIEAIAVKSLLYRAFRQLQTADDPLVGIGIVPMACLTGSVLNLVSFPSQFIST